MQVLLKKCVVLWRFTEVSKKFIYQTILSRQYRICWCIHDLRLGRREKLLRWWTFLIHRFLSVSLLPGFSTNILDRRKYFTHCFDYAQKYNNTHARHKTRHLLRDITSLKKIATIYIANVSCGVRVIKKYTNLSTYILLFPNSIFQVFRKRFITSYIWRETDSATRVGWTHFDIHQLCHVMYKGNLKY